MGSRSVFALCLVVLAVLGPTAAPAAELASCTGSTIRLFPYPPELFRGTCAGGPFTVGAPTTVTITLLPDDHFTGPLSMAVRFGSPSGAGHDVKGYFVDGDLVPFTGAVEATASLAAGTWYLDVRAGYTQERICPSPPLPTECRYFPTYALGDFGGRVTG